MSKRTWTLAVLLITALPAVGASSATAAPPPPGYPTDEVMEVARNPIQGDIPIRRGFYDADTDQGFGFDKAWHKHNITTGTAMRRVMESPHQHRRWNGRIEMHAWAGKMRCNWLWCEITDQIELVGVYEPKSYTEYYNQPVGGTLGMVTLFCQQGGDRRCPDWVTHSLTYPGAPNPYRQRPSELGPGTYVAIGYQPFTGVPGSGVVAGG